jgi:hypothetical protein
VGRRHPDEVALASVSAAGRRLVIGRLELERYPGPSPTQPHPKRRMSRIKPGDSVVPPVHRARPSTAAGSEEEEETAMTDDVSRGPSTSRSRGDTSGWAVGFTVFAAVMMIMVGVWQALAGLIAIVENEFYVQTRNYLFEFDATTWGWIHLVVGVIVAFAGWGLLSGQTWARIVGITLAALSATVNFLFIPYYPFWSMLIIAVDVLVIWALTAHGREYKELKAADAEYRMRR